MKQYVIFTDEADRILFFALLRITGTKWRKQETSASAKLRSLEEWERPEAPLLRRQMRPRSSGDGWQAICLPVLDERLHTSQTDRKINLQKITCAEMRSAISAMMVESGAGVSRQTHYWFRLFRIRPMDREFVNTRSAATGNAEFVPWRN